MRSPPSPNPVAIFKWEDSSSLEHSCWACPTKANSPKALHTCYGIHSVPCLAYHSTMHAIGGAHRCSACTIAKEMHDSRHREIAGLVAEYYSLKIAATSSNHSYVLGERSPNITTLEGPRNYAQYDDEDETDQENVSVTDTASTATSGDTSISKLSKAEQNAVKRARKVAKSQNKAARNQARHLVNITSDDVDKVNAILHGHETEDPSTTHPLATDRAVEDVIARNLGFVKQIKSHKKALQQSVAIGRKEDKERKRAKSRLSQGFEDGETEAVIDAVLERFEIDIGIRSKDGRSGKKTSTPKKIPAGESKKATKSQAAIVQKLRAAIKEDFEKHENDLRQRYIRAGGFFRYAGRTVFERMTDVAKTIDMQTGEEWEKKRKREAMVDAASAGRQQHEHEDEDDDFV